MLIAQVTDLHVVGREQLGQGRVASVTQRAVMLAGNGGVASAWGGWMEPWRRRRTGRR